MNRLRQLREEKGLLQKEVAQALNVDRTTYNKYEKGTSQPNYDMLIRIASFFDVSINYLLGVPEPETHFSAKEVQDAFAARPQTVSTDPWDPENMDYAEKENDTIRILARGVTKMSPENRQKLLDVARVMFAEDFDEQGNKR